MIVLLLAVLIGVVAGLRTFTAPAAISWAAHFGWLQLGSTPLAFMGYAWTSWILTVLAVVELVVDQLPSTPSRTVPTRSGNPNTARTPASTAGGVNANHRRPGGSARLGSATTVSCR